MEKADVTLLPFMTPGESKQKIRPGELAKIISISRTHVWRLVRAGTVPATKKTRGGHFYFVRCPKLTRWINRMSVHGRFYKNEMARAYKKHYGSEKFKAEKTRRHLTALFNKASAYTASNKRKREHRVWKRDQENDDYFYYYLFCTALELTDVLKELPQRTGAESKIKRELINVSREPLINSLTTLRDLINGWLNQA